MTPKKVFSRRRPTNNTLILSLPHCAVVHIIYFIFMLLLWWMEQLSRNRENISIIWHSKLLPISCISMGERFNQPPSHAPDANKWPGPVRHTNWKCFKEILFIRRSGMNISGKLFFIHFTFSFFPMTPNFLSFCERFVIVF